ncbi:MAG: type II toxin-antitoxin system HicB family antitoxin [Ruminococcaceae bacterium]|nr:type II toxin-antitoxin system HicB family antitoxin [Oscillospiraceae bacterium]
MNNILKYKGYLARIEFSVEDMVLYGKIEGIKDLVNFESDSIDKIEEEFHNAVDEYLQMCEELGENPDKAYSGTFNVRISPALHRKLAMKAYKTGMTLNSAVETAIEAYTDNTANWKIEQLYNEVGQYSQYFKNLSYANASPFVNGINRWGKIVNA